MHGTESYIHCTAFCAAGQPPPEFAFGPVEVSELGQLSGAEFSQAAFTGFTLHDKTNTSGPLADQLMCNGTYNFTPASTVDGDLAIVMMPSDGSMSASAVIASTNISDSNLDISLGQFWVVSLKVSRADDRAYSEHHHPV